MVRHEQERTALLELKASKEEERRKNALDNVAPVAHGAPFKPAKSLAQYAGAPFRDAAPGTFHPLDGVDSFNQAKRDFFASYDSNSTTSSGSWPAGFSGFDSVMHNGFNDDKTHLLTTSQGA